MARRAAGPTGSPPPARHGAPGEQVTGEHPGGRTGEHAAAHRGDDGGEDLARLRESLLHGPAARTGQAGHDGPPLRVEDPVHPRLDAEVGADLPWLDADPDSLAAGESTLMHPDDLAALHALPATGTEADPWGAPWYDAGLPEPDGHGRQSAARAPSGDVPLVERRWVQLVACALLCLVVGAAAALLVTAGQVDAARADADLQREVATSARADLGRERTARAAERASSAALPPAPLPTPLPAPSSDPGTLPEAPAPPGSPAPTLPTDVERPPVAEAPAPTADPGPPPPGPSPSPGRGAASPTTPGSSAAQDGGAASPGASADPSSGRTTDQQTGEQDPGTQDDDPAPGQQCPAPEAGSPAAGGDGPTTCP